MKRKSGDSGRGGGGQRYGGHFSETIQPSLSSLSFIIRDEADVHRSGVNKLCMYEAEKLLYTAGRDGTVRAWGINGYCDGRDGS